MPISEYRALLMPLPCQHLNDVTYLTSGVYDEWGVEGTQRLSSYLVASGPPLTVESAIYPRHRFVGWLHQMAQAADVALRCEATVHTLTEDWPTGRDDLFLRGLLPDTPPGTVCGDILIAGILQPIALGSPHLESACKWVEDGGPGRRVLYMVCLLSDLEGIMRVLEREARSCKVVDVIAPIFYGRRPSFVGLVVARGAETVLFVDYLDIIGRLNFYESEARPSRDSTGSCLDCRVLAGIYRRLYGYPP